MNEILDLLSRFDKNPEIVQLWYEITYLRIVLSQSLDEKQAERIDIEKARLDAQDIVKKRFPKLTIEFVPKIND